MLDKSIYNYLSDRDEEIFTQFLNDETNNWSFPHTVHNIRTESGDTYIVESGKENTETILYLHGYGLNSISGKKFLSGLGKKYHVLAPDIMWQIGRSVPRHAIDKKKLVECYGKWIIEVLDYFRIEKVNIVGLSFGAWITMSFALKHSDRIKTITAISPAGFFAPLNLSLLYDQIRSAFFPGRSNIRKFIVNSYGKKNILDEFDYELLTMVMKHCRKNSPALVPATVFTDSELGMIKNPLLLIIGTDDIYLKKDRICERVSRLVKNAKIVQLENAAHYLHNTHYDKVEKEVMELIEKRL